MKGEALRELEKLALEAKRIKHPNMPAFAIVKPSFSDQDTNSLTTAILEAIRLHGGFATRVQTQGQYDPTRKIWRKGQTVIGMPDITGIINGKSISIEVKNKRTRDRLSHHQKDTIKRIQDAGGLCFVARDFESFYAWFKSCIDPQQTVSTAQKPIESTIK